MERLTKRCKQALNDKMTKFKNFIEIALSEPKYHEKGNFSTQSTYDIYETNKLYPMASKLADYEDAEEQGLLLRLPYKVGDTVYFIYHNAVCHSEVKRFFQCNSTKNWGIVLCRMYPDLYFDQIGKTVFLTREEAEKALADMGV